jgi:DNA-binding beta-propeller fold protein YncE
VLTTDFSTGSYSVVDLTTRNVTRDIRRGGVHSDAVARAFGGRIYVVNRLNADNIQVIDPQQGYTTPANAQVSVGNGTNPQDIAFVSATKAYVSRYGRTAASLLILNPTTLAILGERDLRSLIKPNDRDGTPEPSFMLINNGLLYVTLQHLDELAFLFPPVASGEVAVIDPVTDNIVTVIQLPFANPFPQIRFSPTLRRILVSCNGVFGVNDGGIVAIDPATNTVDASLRITEAALGGDITDFEVVSSTKAFAVVLDSNFESTLVTFNPSTGQRLATVLGPRGISIPHIAINSRNELYAAVNDETTATPGLRVFDTVTDRDLIPGPLNVGQLPPNWVLFLE